MTGSLPLPEVGENNSSADPRVRALLSQYNELLNSENKLPNTSLTGVIGWYTPKVIATEQTRENVAFGTLTTPDEITSVVVPENGLMVIAYSAIVKSSAEEAGKIAIFIGANQLKSAGSTVPVAVETATSGTAFATLSSSLVGLSVNVSKGTSFVTTGQTLTASSTTGGLCYVQRLAAGTYNVSVQYKATSGSVTAKERYLAVGVSR